MAKYRITPSSKAIIQLPISIGHKAEKGVEAIEFDVTAWVETYGSGTATIIMKRWGDAIPYPIALEIDENNKATWTLSDIDTAKAGMAYAQLNYIVGETVVKKSDIYTFRVMDSLTGEGEPPEAYESWLEHLTHLAAEAMAEVLDIEGIVTDKTLTVDGGIADAKATGDALALKADKSTTYTKTEVDQMIEDVEVETDTTLSVSGRPADAKATGDALSALEDAVTEETDKLKADLGSVYGDINESSRWTSGTLTVSAGTEADSNARIRSSHIFNVNMVEPEQGYKISLYAYDNTGTYIGVWNGDAFVKTNSDDNWFTSKLDIENINADYAYRIVLAKTSNLAITTDDYNKCKLLAVKTDSTLTQKHKPGDSYVIGKRFESNDRLFMGAAITGWVENYYINTSGSTVDINALVASTSGFRTVAVPCVPFERFLINGTGAYSAGLWAFIDSNGNLLERKGAGTCVNEVIIAPANSAYLVLNDKTDSESYRYGLLESLANIGKKHLNICIFGNSYAADGWSYVPFILKKYGITVNIYMYYRGSGSIRRLVAEWEETGETGLDIYGGAHVRRMLHIDTRTSTKWDYVEAGHSAKEILEYANDETKGIGEWDIITLQSVSSEQYSDGNGGWTRKPGLEPYFRQAINLINASYKKPYNLALYTTYNRIISIGGVPISALDDRVETLKADEAVYNSEPFNFVIPVGAAVFSGRTNALLASTDISDVGNLWSPDKIHLQEGVPCYLAACTVCQAIFNKFYPRFSILGDNTRISAGILSDWRAPMQDGTPKTVDAIYYELAQKCAVNAQIHPFDITPIYSPSDNTEIVYDRPKYWADSMIDTSSITD